MNEWHSENNGEVKWGVKSSRKYVRHTAHRSGTPLPVCFRQRLRRSKLVGPVSDSANPSRKNDVDHTYIMTILHRRETQVRIGIVRQCSAIIGYLRELFYKLPSYTCLSFIQFRWPDVIYFRPADFYAYACFISDLRSWENQIQGSFFHINLSKMINLLTSSLFFPSDWEKANVTAIFKKGDETSPCNYRPVSLTSQVCKILESIVKSHVRSLKKVWINQGNSTWFC